MPFAPMNLRLTHPLPPGGTLTLGYPEGRNEGHFFGGAAHTLSIDGEFFRAPRDFTLLAFGPAPTVAAPVSGLQTLPVVAQPAAPGEVADTAGYLARAYAATGRTLVLIRPDGYIGLISDAGDPAAVADYLATLA